MERYVDLYDYYKGQRLEYRGILSWHWDASWKQLVPPGITLTATKPLETQSTTGAFSKESFSVELVDFSGFQDIPWHDISTNKNYLNRYYVVRVEVRLNVSIVQRGSTKTQVLDTWSNATTPLDRSREELIELPPNL